MLLWLYSLAHAVCRPINCMDRQGCIVNNHFWGWGLRELHKLGHLERIEFFSLVSTVSIFSFQYSEIIGVFAVGDANSQPVSIICHFNVSD